MKQLQVSRPAGWRRALVMALAILTVCVAGAQKIQYTEPEREDYRNMNFEIVGKVGGNILVYKNYRSNNVISVYDNDMKLVERVNLKDLPDRIINADFIAYPDYCYMIYQVQKRNTVYCTAIKFDGQAKQVGEPIDLDTTHIGTFQNTSKIYSVMASENKQRIGIVKINRRNDKIHALTALVFNPALEPQRRELLEIQMEGRSNFLSEFQVDNDGDIYFLKCYSNGNNDVLTKAELVYKPASRDGFTLYPLQANEKSLDEIRLRVDNANRKLIINTFYYAKRRGNIEGLFTAYWNKDSLKQTAGSMIAFSDSLRILAKGETSTKTAFNDFFITHIFPRKDGGFIMAAESNYTTSRNGNPWSRWDYFNSYPYYTNFDYYNLGGRSWYWNSWDRYSNRQQTTYHSENVVIWSFDANGKQEWENIVHKDQIDDNTEDFVSYQVLVTGGQLHFLFNLRERSAMLMYDHSLTPDGKISRNPTLKNLDRQRELMPRHGKQISARQMIFPCMYKSYVCFAKIEF